MQPYFCCPSPLRPPPPPPRRRHGAHLRAHNRPDVVLASAAVVAQLKSAAQLLVDINRYSDSNSQLSAKLENSYCVTLTSFFQSFACCFEYYRQSKLGKGSSSEQQSLRRVASPSKTPKSTKNWTFTKVRPKFFFKMLF